MRNMYHTEGKVSYL